MRLFIILLLSYPFYLAAQSVSATYSAGDISTSLPPFNPTCNGPVTTLSVDLPGGGPWVVTGIDIAYDMLAQSTGWKSHQRSQVYCQTTEQNEPSVYAGTGDENGVQSYLRSNVAIANGTYAGGTSLIFEMKAMRTTEGSGCNTTYNRVNNFTWEITVYYTTYTESGSVGIGTSSPDPSALIDLSCATKGLLPPRMNTGLRLAIEEPATGLVVYDTDVDKLYCYSGSSWVPIIFDFTTLIRDADNDTKIQVEEFADEDTIRFTVGGNQIALFDNKSLQLKGPGQNTFIGYQAGLSDDGSFDNTFIGYAPGKENLTGYSNVYIGGGSGERNMTGIQNVFIGQEAGAYNTEKQNVFIGTYAGLDNQGVMNSFIGCYSGWATNLGSYNTFTGGWTGFYTEGEYNTFIGYKAGEYTTIPHANTFIGAQSGLENEIGTNNTCLGRFSDFSSSALHNAVAIGQAAVTNADYKIRIGNTAVTVIEGQVDFSFPSDGRFKFNVKNDVPGLAFIQKLRPVTYQFDMKGYNELIRPSNWADRLGRDELADIQDEENLRSQIIHSGFIAQEVEEAAIDVGYDFHGLVKPTNPKDNYGLRYGEFVVPLVKAVQEQQELIEQLQNQLTELLKLNSEMENKFALLEERMKELNEAILKN